MKRFTNQNGLTMIEVLVAAVILVIVSVALLGLYSNNFGWIIGAGFRAQALDKAKTTIDELIATGTGSTSESITISFPGVSAVTVTGDYIEATETDGPNNSVPVTLRTFIPTDPD
jgi:prepilin-type N-terminal cleavage/methylation domain-containing protein